MDYAQSVVKILGGDKNFVWEGVFERRGIFYVQWKAYMIEGGIGVMHQDASLHETVYDVILI